MRVNTTPSVTLFSILFSLLLIVASACGQADPPNASPGEGDRGAQHGSVQSADRRRHGD